MKMFLTRSAATPRRRDRDVTQVDLPTATFRDWTHRRAVLKDVEGVAFVHLEKQDIVRHPLGAADSSGVR